MDGRSAGRVVETGQLQLQFAAEAPKHWLQMSEALFMMRAATPAIGGIVRVFAASEYGIIVELDNRAGYRLVSSTGRIGPVLDSAASIVGHMPYTDWAETSEEVDLEAWLVERGLSSDMLQPRTDRLSSV